MAAEGHRGGGQGPRFQDKEFGKATPCVIRGVANNLGRVSVGISHNPGGFEVEGIRGWWHHVCRERSPSANRLLVTVDGGSSNGTQMRLSKTELSRRRSGRPASTSKSVTRRRRPKLGTRSSTS